MTILVNIEKNLFVVCGIFLLEEEGIGVFMLGGYLKEVIDCFGFREVVVLLGDNGIESWSYDDFWVCLMDVVCVLLVVGISKGMCVGILMMN